MGDFKFEEEYRKKYNETKLEDIMIFRSGPMASTYIEGMDFDDNARALFEYALRSGLNSKYKLVWIVKDPAQWAGRFETYDNVLFLPWEDADSDDRDKRDSFFYHLCLAKYLFMTDSYGFALGCRKDQIRVMLWHGCGFKTRLGFSPNEDHYEYMTVTGDEYAKTYARVFGLRDDQMLVTGYPKVDYIFHPLFDRLESLGIPKDGRYVFWLPTFRNTCITGLERHNHTKPKGDVGLPVVTDPEGLKKIDSRLKEADAVLVIKLHPFQDRKMICDMSEYSNICLLDNHKLLEEDIQTNQILGCADALISDYSSAAVDYLVLDRPIAFTLDDKESYEKERGFFWDDVIPHLPGELVYDFDGFYAFLSDVLDGKDPGAERRHRIAGEMQKYCDDRNSERVFRELGII